MCFSQRKFQFKLTKNLSMYEIKCGIRYYSEIQTIQQNRHKIIWIRKYTFNFACTLAINITESSLQTARCPIARLTVFANKRCAHTLPTDAFIIGGTWIVVVTGNCVSVGPCVWAIRITDLFRTKNDS